MKNNYLTNGPITKALVKLALPIMATFCTNDLYNDGHDLVRKNRK